MRIITVFGVIKGGKIPVLLGNKYSIGKKKLGCFKGFAHFHTLLSDCILFSPGPGCSKHR